MSMDFNDPSLKKILRKGFAEKASWAEVRAKKKLRDGEIKIAIKSQFHSYRILLFGTQIGINGKIVDWKAANEYLIELKNNEITEEFLKYSYKKWVKETGVETNFKKTLPK